MAADETVALTMTMGVLKDVNVLCMCRMAGSA